MELKVEYIGIDQVKPYENNAKIHTPEQIDQIKKSINEFGMNDPIGITGQDNIIVEGHGRLIACKELGMREIPVIRLDHLTEEQRKAYTLIHNQTTMNTIHPTMKPLELIGKLVHNSSEKGELVLDLFGGSGSTLIVCEQLGRICYTMEYDPVYIDAIINRWEEYTGEKAVKIT